jgi:glutathione S-transferase
VPPGKQYEEKTMKLYYSPGACSLSVNIALREAGVSFDPVRVDLSTHKLESGEDFYAVSPRGYVPVLELDDGSRHTEVSALLQYVADLAPAGKLIPPFGTVERLRVLEWLAFTSTELHKGFGPLWNRHLEESVKQSTKEKLAKRLRELNEHLATNDFLTGPFAVADAYCFTVVSWANLLQVDLGPFQNVQAYLARVRSRPKVREAMQTEGLIKE